MPTSGPVVEVTGEEGKSFSLKLPIEHELRVFVDRRGDWQVVVASLAEVADRPVEVPVSVPATAATPPREIPRAPVDVSQVKRGRGRPMGSQNKRRPVNQRRLKGPMTPGALSDYLRESGNGLTEGAPQTEQQ